MGAVQKKGIRQTVDVPVAGHSVATHFLENRTAIRYLLLLLGHNSTKTTEIYTHVAKTSFKGIKDLLS